MVGERRNAKEEEGTVATDAIMPAEGERPSLVQLAELLSGGSGSLAVIR